LHSHPAAAAAAAAATAVKSTPHHCTEQPTAAATKRISTEEGAGVIRGPNATTRASLTRRTKRCVAEWGVKWGAFPEELSKQLKGVDLAVVASTTTTTTSTTAATSLQAFAAVAIVRAPLRFVREDLQQTRGRSQCGSGVGLSA
jgi:hypothetical protein